MDPFSLFKDTKEIRPPSSLFSTNLGRPKHERGDIHWIGEALPAPGSIATSGAATVGSSAIPAREDHYHGAGDDTPFPVGYVETFEDLADWIGTTNWSISSGRALKSNAGLTHMIYTEKMPTDDFTVEATFLAIASSSTATGHITARSNLARTEYYSAGWTSPNEYRITKDSNVTLASVTASFPGADVVFRLEVNGNAISFYVDDVLTLSAIDVSYNDVDHRYGGLLGSTSSVTNIYFDDWSITNRTVVPIGPTVIISGVLSVDGLYQSIKTASITGTYALDLDSGGVGGFVLTMTGNTTLSITDAPPGNSIYTFDIIISGAFTLTWPTIKWPTGTTPTYTTPSVYRLFTFDGGTNWYGIQIGSAFA